VVLGTVTELVMALPMAMYFHRASLFALPANMVVIPVVAVLAGSAVGTFMGALVSPWAALLPGAATAVLLHGVTGVIGRISRLQAADLRVPGPVCGGLRCWLSGCWAGAAGR
jgi:competence protein ComEC